MRVDLRFRDRILARFMLDRLPLPLMDAIARKKERLFSLAQTVPLRTQGQWIDRINIPGAGRVYAVEFALGKIKEAGPAEEQIQELLILDIQEVR